MILGHSNKRTEIESGVASELASAFETSSLPVETCLQAFPRHVRRQDVARFLTRYEIFKHMLPANGSIVECGVYIGAGLMSWAHFSAIMEPYNHSRRIIGFDTFAGFPSVHEKDHGQDISEHLQEGGLSTDDKVVAELKHLIDLHDQNRPLGHIPKVELVAGDATQTIPVYLDQNSHLLISLLYLDFDIYEPTQVALETLYSRVVKGGIIVFDELNHPNFPGETLALLEKLDLQHVALKRMPFDPYISYFEK